MFWAHVVPLAVGRSLHELAAVTLIKTMGREAAESRVPRVHSHLAGLRNAFVTAVPGLESGLARQAEQLRQRWNYHGMALLSAVANHTEPEILMEEATIAMVHPALGGGGEAHPAYNVAHVEAVLVDPVPELPEVLRLAWLLANPEDREDFQNRGRQRVQERFAWPVVAAQTIDLFRAALAHRRGVMSSMEVVRA